METEREAKKRSMTSRLSMMAARMFYLLTAKDWKDKYSQGECIHRKTNIRQGCHEGPQPHRIMLQRVKRSGERKRSDPIMYYRMST
jgi:hypothetical protein